MFTDNILQGRVFGHLYKPTTPIYFLLEEKLQYVLFNPIGKDHFFVIF